jgi:hypothetical protein
MIFYQRRFWLPGIPTPNQANWTLPTMSSFGFTSPLFLWVPGFQRVSRPVHPEECQQAALACRDVARPEAARKIARLLGKKLFLT